MVLNPEPNYSASVVKPFTDLFLITAHPRYDERGFYCERFNEVTLNEFIGRPLRFVQDGTSFSRKNVFRGFHGDFKTWKLVSCLLGEVLSVVIDLNPKSVTYGEFFSVILGQHNFRQLLIPPGFGNSMLALTDEVLYHYKQTTFYEPGRQFTFGYAAYDKWPIENMIMSLRDLTAEAWSVGSFEEAMKKREDLEGNPFLS